MPPSWQYKEGGRAHQFGTFLRKREMGLLANLLVGIRPEKLISLESQPQKVRQFPEDMIPIKLK